MQRPSSPLRSPFRARRLAAIAVASCCGVAPGVRALAVPANPAPVVLTQPDGRKFTARPWGDERAAGVATAEGFAILREEAGGWWVYSALDARGVAQPTGHVVGYDAPPPDAARPSQMPRRALRPSAAAGPAPDGAPDGVGAGAPVRLSSPHRLLVLLVDFTPSESRGTSDADWAAFAFAGGRDVAPRSVADYWREVSGGALVITAAAEDAATVDDGVVAVSLDRPHPRPAATGDENRLVTRDALVAADAHVDFAAFDDDGDGYLNTHELHVLVVVRGYEDAYGADRSECADGGGVWGHQWALGGTVEVPRLDGVYVGAWWGAPVDGPQRGGYMQIGEWHCASGDAPGRMATIGVAVHELGHDLGTGAPDLYDTDQSSRGVGAWCLMGNGAWNRTDGPGGSAPAWPMAWTRWMFGFVEPARVSSSVDHVFPQIETSETHDGGVALLLENPGGIDWQRQGSSGTGEYFLVENRQQVGFDAGLPGAGLLVWHVDETAPADGTANAGEGDGPAGDRRLVALEQADGRFELECRDGCNEGDAGDAWVARAGAAFAHDTTPSSRLRGGAASGVIVGDVGASGAWMTASLSECGVLVLSDEVCDGLDNNCDGVVDNGGGNACGGVCALRGVLGEACDGADADACADDVTVCAGPNDVGCSNGVDEGDPCDGADNNCDGVADNDGTNACGGSCALVHAPGSACEGGDGCLDDRYTCAGPNATRCAAEDGGGEVCNGLDDNCDGVMLAGEDDADGDGFVACGDASTCTWRGGAPFEDLATIGGATALPLSGDDSSTSVTLPFPFVFDGSEATRALVSTNGYLALRSTFSIEFNNVCIPSSAEPNGFVAPFWDDLVVDAGVGRVWTALLGDAGRRRFVVQWSHVRPFGAAADLNFQVVLHERGGAIELRYGVMTGVVRAVNGSGATIGWEGHDGRSGVQVACNQAGAVAAGTGVMLLRCGGDCDDARGEMRPGAGELCNGVDDNCDGTVDEGEGACGSACAMAHPPGAPCDGPDVDACADDVYVCTGVGVTACAAGADDVDVCDGADNDCNGVADDGGTNACGGSCALADAPGAACDGGDTDACADDMYECAGRNEVACAAGFDDPEKCNGADDDCDGEADEGLVACGLYDSDGDGVGDGADVCPWVVDDQRDRDLDGAGDACDVDPPRPDLVVESARAGYGTRGRTAWVRVVVLNRGEAAVTRPFALGLRPAGWAKAGYQSSALVLKGGEVLAAGARVAVRVELPVKTLWDVVADAGRVVDESDETNNVRPVRVP